MESGTLAAGTDRDTRRTLTRALIRWLPVLAAIPFALFFVSSAIVSYDDHLTPCQLILEQGGLPAVDACWECHQPPLYYLAGAAMLAAARGLSGALPPSLAFSTLKLLALLLSLGTLALLASLARRYFPDRPGLQLLALVVPLATPRFLLSGVMTGNDGAVLFTGTFVLWLAARGATVERRHLAWAAGLGAAAGLAVLSKYNGFALIPAVAAGIWAARRGIGWRRRFVAIAVAAAAFAALTGPWFVRNIVESGTPVPTRMAWGETPDSETYSLFDVRPLALLETPFRLEEVLKPGEGLPYLTHQVLTPADTSLWTKTYALFWADALYYLHQPPAAWTAARYVLAFPVCLVALFGLLVGWRRIARGEELGAPHRVASLVLVPVLLLLYFAFVVRYPWVRLNHGRASFLLPLLAPFGLCYALGFQALTAGRGPWLKWLLAGSLGLLVLSVVGYEAFLLARYL